MILLRLVGFFLVVMVFFSFGAVAGSRSRSMTPERAPSPNFLDLSIIFLSWLAAIAAYMSGYRTAAATAIGSGTGLFTGFILHRLLKQTPGDKLRVGNSGGKTPAARLESSTSTTPQSEDHLRPNWRSFARQVGGFQSGLLLGAFYFIAIMPFGILVGNLGDPLGLKVPRGESFWRRREGDSQSLEEARRQS